MNIRSRKIDQLVTHLAIDSQGKPVTLTMAKADDGTAWEFRSNPNRWEPLPPLPPAYEVVPPPALHAPSPGPALAPGAVSIAPPADPSTEGGK
jgi:hypothetical protein